MPCKHEHERKHERRISCAPRLVREQKDFCNCVPFAGTGTGSNVICASSQEALPNTMAGTISNFSIQPIVVTFTFQSGGSVPFTIQPNSPFSFTLAKLKKLDYVGGRP